MATASAPAKVHLIGEHAVVYGEPAIIASVGLRTTVVAEKAGDVKFADSKWPDKGFACSANDAIGIAKKASGLWNECNERRDFTPLFNFVKADSSRNYRKALVGIALSRLGITGGVHLSAVSDIPMGAGIGSSAAFAVAIVKAIAAEYGKHVTDEQVNGIAYEMEKIIHGTPSGGDNSACCFGGLLWFQRGSPNIIRPLQQAHKLENFALVYTGKPEKSTGELVQLVRNLDEGFRNERVRKIGQMTHEMIGVLKSKDYSRLKEIINDTHKNLAELGVSTEEMERIASEVKAIGGAAKLCGAGGGGMMLCWHEDVAKLKETVASLGYAPMKADLAVEGVRLEKHF